MQHVQVKARSTLVMCLLLTLLAGCQPPDGRPTPTFVSVVGTPAATVSITPAETAPTPTGVAQRPRPADPSSENVIFRGDYARTGVLEWQGTSQQRPVGELLWKYGGSFGGCHYPPTPYKGVAYFGCGGEFHAVEIRTGKELWSIEDLGARSPIIVIDGLLYFGAVNRHDDEWDLRLAVVDPNKQSVVREYPSESKIGGSPIVVDGTAYYLQWSTLHALDLSTGKDKWTFEKGGMISGRYDVSPAAGLGMVYFANVGEGMSGDVVTPGGHLYAVDMATGREVWSYPTHSASTPVVNEDTGLVYVGTDQSLVALDAKTGQQRWLVSDAYGPPALLESTLYAGSGSGHLLALDAGTGEERWRLAVAEGVSTPPTISGGVIYFGAGPFSFQAVDLTTREVLLDFKTVDRVETAPVISDGVVLFNDWDSLYALGPQSAADAGGATTTPPPDTQAPPASMFGGDARHTGAYSAPGAPELAGVRWEADLGGAVQSSPAILDGTLFIGASNGYFYAFDAVSGAVRWRFKADAGIVSSPAVAEGTVYFASLDTYFYALDAATGEMRWRFKTGAGVVSSPALAGGAVYFGGMDKQMYGVDAATGKELWRFAAESSLPTSPAVEDGVVYFGDADGNLHSLDARTGVELHKDPFWMVEQITSAVSVKDATVYFGSEYGYLYVIDPATAREKWSFKSDAAAYDDRSSVQTVPALSGDSVYFGSKNSKVFAVSTKSTQQRWSFDTGGPVRASPAVAGGVVYVGSDSGNLYALDESSGKERWHYSTGAPIAAAPVPYGDAVYVSSENGHIYCLQSPVLAAQPTPAAPGAVVTPTAIGEHPGPGAAESPTPAPRSTTVAMYRGDPLHSGFYDTKGIEQQPDVLWSFRPVGNPDGAPIYADGTLYFSTEAGRFYAVDAEIGIEKWQFQTKEREEMHSSPAVANGTVYFGSLDGYFYALDAQTGKERWKFDAGSRVWSSPTWAGGVVYFGDDQGRVYGLDGETGKEVWRFEIQGDMDTSVWGAPAVDEASNTIYIPGRDGFLYAVDKTTAQEKWRFDSGYLILSSPAVADGLVLFSNWYPSTYALDAATGKLAWHMEGVGSKQDSVAVHEGVAYFGEDSEPNFYAVTAKTGQVLWKADLPDAADKSPVVAGGLVYTTGFSGGVYGLDIQTGKLKWDYHAGFGLTSPVVWNGTLYFGSMGDQIFALR